MSADQKTLATILTEHLSLYRAMSHFELASRLDLQHHQDHVDVSDGVTPDGRGYTIETNIYWDDRPKLHIRVISDLSTGAGGRLLGFLPVFRPDITDGFILAPDGTFIDE